MPLYDFECKNGHRTEELVNSSVKHLKCPTCGTRAKRQVSAPHIDWQAFVWGPTASEPAIDKWDRMRKQKMAIEQRNLDRHGTYD